jgi:thiol-disulfide isomerase/thioredoxin
MLQQRPSLNSFRNRKAAPAVLGDEEGRMRLRLTLLLPAVLALGTACAREDASRAEAPHFESFALETFEGDSVSLADLEGKVSLVVFWASWCPACRAELPMLDSLNAAVNHPDFAIVAINEEWNEGAARGYAAAKGYTMPMALGRGRMHKQYNYWGLPYMVLLDRQGRVLEEWYGYPGRQAFNEKVAGRAMEELLSSGAL